MKRGGRTFEEEKKYLEPVSKCKYRIKPGFVPHMNVPGYFYVNDPLKALVLEELETYCEGAASAGGFIPAVTLISSGSGR